MPQISQCLKLSDQLLATLSDYDKVVIVMHDNPDPDAIASGWALSVLIEEKLGLPVRLVGGGAIVRAENRHMVELLQPPVELVDSLEMTPATATLLIDCGVNANNHLLARSGITPVGVIDHHLTGKNLLDVSVPFSDLRANVAASASVTASYLREQGVDPGPKLATALLYAIHTETKGYETYYSPLDRSILPWLTERAEPSMLAEIENAPLTRDYFGDLSLAMQSTFIYDDTAICFLPRANGAEIVGEVADLLIRCDGVRRVLCAAIIDVDLVFSARTQTHCGNAAELLQATLAGRGGAGGHTHRAGGKIAKVARGEKIAEELEADLRRRWLAACNVQQKRGTRLIPKREIVENL